jgi:hypothetical protein
MQRAGIQSAEVIPKKGPLFPTMGLRGSQEKSPIVRPVHKSVIRFFEHQLASRHLNYKCVSGNMKRLKFKLISIVLAFVFALAQSQAQEPLRAGIDVPEPNIIKIVEIEYPESVMGSAVALIIRILIDEQGTVTDAIGQSNSSLMDAAKSTLKKWRFSPTFVNGKTVPVAAKIVILFSDGDLPYAIDLGQDYAQFVRLDSVANFCTFSVTLDRDGNLNEEPDSLVIDDEAISKNLGKDTVENLYRNPQRVSRKQLCASRKIFSLFPEPDVSFSQIIEKIVPFAVYRLHSPRYRFPDSNYIQNTRPGWKQLYYSVLLVSNGSQFIRLAGIDPDVKPPKLDIDFSRLTVNLKDSSHKSGALYFYTVFVDENGSILGVESRDSRDETVIAALSNATVLAPGTRNGKPVPTAVIVAIPVK